MRQFVVIGHDVPTNPDAVSLSDIPGAGRLDLLCRSVGAGVFLSHGIRDAVRVHLVLDDAFTVTIDTDTVRHLHPDERNIAARLREALAATDDAIGHMPADVSPGVTLRRTGFDATIERVVGDGHGRAAVDPADATLLHLHENGDPLKEVDPPENPVFVLSDHSDFTTAEAAILGDRADARVRVGPERLHADHTITVVHNWLDTAGYTMY